MTAAYQAAGCPIKSTTSRNATAVGSVGSGHALFVNGLVGSAATGVASIGHNLGCQNLVEQVRDLGIILAKHTTFQAQEQRQIIAQLLGDLDLGETLPGLGIRARFG